MPIYEYQGKSYDIATTDADEARRKIQAYLDVNEPGALRSFGRSAASTADVALNAATGTLDVLARPFARAYYGGIKGMTGDELENRITAETTSPKDIIGRSLGITETPQYQNEAARRGTQALGQMIEQNVINPVAEATGMTPGYVSDVATVASAGLPAIPGVARAGSRVGMAGGQAMYAAERGATQAAKTAGRVAMAPVRAAAQTTQGLFGGATGRIAAPGRTPGPLQTPSSRIPLGETYIDPADWARFQRGEITLDQLQNRPIEQLPRNAVDRAALALAGNEMPAAGQGFRAFGEALGRQYARRPFLGLLDIGAGSLGVPPPVATYRGMQALGDLYLSKRGFDPNLPQQLQAAQGQAGVDIMRQRAANQPLRIPYNPTPAQPAPPPTMYVSPEGVAGTNVGQVSQAGAQQKYAPQPRVVATPESIQAEAAQKAAQGVVQNDKTAAIIEQIRARREAELAAKAQAAAGSNYRPPAVEPVAPAQPAAPRTLAERQAALKGQPSQTLFEETQPVQPVKPDVEYGSPEWQAREAERSAALQERLDQPTSALEDYNDWKRDPAGYIRRQGRGRPGTLGMVSPKPSGSKTIVSSMKMSDKDFAALPTKEDVANSSFRELISQDVDQFAKSYRYRDGNKMVEVITTTVFPDRPISTSRAYNPKTGERVPVGKDWDPKTDPEPLTSQLKSKFGRK